MSRRGCYFAARKDAVVAGVAITANCGYSIVNPEFCKGNLRNIFALLSKHPF